MKRCNRLYRGGIAAALILCMALPLFGCSAGEPPVQSPAPSDLPTLDPTVSESPAPSEAPSEAPSPEPEIQAVYVGADQVFRGYLVLVGRETPLPQNYEAADLVNLYEYQSAWSNEPHLLSQFSTEMLGDRVAFEAMLQMLKQARGDGYNEAGSSEGFYLSAAHRTLEKQQSMYEYWYNNYLNQGLGEEEARIQADLTCLPPGQSEHHTGLAFDMGIVNQDITFGDTEQYQWTIRHCMDYGFILRYTGEKEEITGIRPEPWHLRYVGAPHARYIMEQGICLEEYIQALHGAPIEITQDGTVYHVEYRALADLPAEGDPEDGLLKYRIELPAGASYTVSGDGAAGVLLTWWMPGA